jgi:membrane protein
MILKVLLEADILSNLNKEIYYIYVLIKWPLAFVLIFFSIKLIYTLAPDFKIESKNVTRGSVFTTLGWIFVTLIYSYYVNNIAHYDIFYSSLSNIIVLMTWIYILAYILVLGIAINASSYQVEKSGTNNE